ncbi:MAG: ribonuclease P protein component [Deltaproteobacteria bacterium]|nr:ribonuclease P protein component [Deltaproteobacteria bacterium]MBW2135993.1 ribonuclease P protein component [Deltaproteobacteria bacterium]
MGSFSFSKRERILRRRDFIRLYRKGSIYHTAHFKISFMENGLDVTRLGITVGRRVGNAVRRNRIKRLVREVFRLHKAGFPKGYDLIVTAKRGAADLGFRDVERELSEFLLDERLCSSF